ncbi:hypothetical protein Slin15195_G084010 [Septoria linicola]|uniref:Uncharacterized protein n=1 Tax=Septoria linicola TaxID=215465 RepID=A0A9Q9EM29_9PEZI|nr:hypothetical protein Slin15195_G084010 [Septoria linicola]
MSLRNFLGNPSNPANSSNPIRTQNRIVPRITSLPVSGSAVSHRAKGRRLKTVQDYTLPGEDDTPFQHLPTERFRRHVFDIVVERLRSSNMNVAAVSEYALRFLLPQSANPAAKSDWHRLLEYPMLLPDINLKALLHMKTSDANSPPHTPCSTVYYVRSLPITVRVLLQVIQVLQERNYKFDELDHWQRMVSHITGLDVTVYLRYIGMSSKVSPWQRHATDLVQRTNEVYGIFMQILAEIDTMAVTACSVYSFPSAATKALRAPDGSLLPVDTSMIDIKESSLIALFGKPTLLNRQPGGYHTSYEPEDKDLVLFHNLHTSGFKGLEQLVDSARAVDYVGSDYQPIQDSTRSIVNRWMRDVCQFGRGHDVELGTDAIPVTDEMEVTWAKQATPATVHGHVLLLFIGDYCPLEAILNPANFWDQPARAVMYLKNTLSRYLALEKDSTSPQVVWNAALIMQLAEAGLLPWVDYQYTPKRRPLREESAELLRQNLSALRPLIVPTFEGNVCMIVRNNFVGIYREKGVLLGMVGRPEIQYFTDSGEIRNKGNKAIVAEHPIYNLLRTQAYSASHILIEHSLISRWLVLYRESVHGSQLHGVESFQLEQVERAASHGGCIIKMNFAPLP